jgi:hypothetical protein
VNGNLPLTPIITSFVSAIEPSDKSVHLRASACPPASTGTAATSHSLISPRRDYDYFSDLDQKLARLEARLAEGRPPGPQHSRDILEPTRTLSAVDERVRHIRKVSILEIPNA